MTDKKLEPIEVLIEELFEKSIEDFSKDEINHYKDIIDIITYKEIDCTPLIYEKLKNSKGGLSHYQKQSIIYEMALVNQEMEIFEHIRAKKEKSNPLTEYVIEHSRLRAARRKKTTHKKNIHLSTPDNINKDVVLHLLKTWEINKQAITKAQKMSLIMKLEKING